MTLSSLLASAFTFTALATGVEKGTAVEFLFAGPDSDRAYETMFLLDESVDAFCQRLEKAGIPRGRPVDSSVCRLWPVGCCVNFSPAPTNYVNGTLPDGYPPMPFVYTGGSRTTNASCVANDTMPSSVCAYYSLDQSPIVFNGLIDQGTAYGSFTAAKTIKKGTRVPFTVTWDAHSMPRHLDLTIHPNDARAVLERLRKESAAAEVDATIGFDGALTVEEATAAAQALSIIDSSRVKINGVSNIFFRAFLPLVKWQDRQERLQQPFELTLRPDGSECLLFIEEDWSGPGDDPTLTPRQIAFSDASHYKKTDTCFIFCVKTDKVSRILTAMSRLKDSSVKNWYVFSNP